MPVAESELVFASPFQCLVAVMLSAQCTDKRVNMVTPALFAAYPTPEALAKATSDEVFEYVKSVSYPRSKAEHLVQMAQRLVDVYQGQVPDNIDPARRRTQDGERSMRRHMEPADYGCRHPYLPRE